MERSDCWKMAYELITANKTKNSIELCENIPCSEVVECQRYLGWAYYKEDNMEVALSWFSKAAQKEDAEALFGVGSIHFVQKDFLAALQHFELAASYGYSRAYNWIGYIYQQGLGLPKDYKSAVSYYKQGAAHGYLVSERALIHLTFQHGNMFSKINALPKYVYILLKASLIAYRNINDERLVDIPNAFESRRKVQWVS